MMNTLKIKDRVYFKSELLENTNGIIHGFTSKLGGFSYGKIDGLNLGFRVGDNAENVIKNYKLVAQDLRLLYENITAAKQIHSADIRVITSEEKGFGVSKTDCVFEADGLITNCKDIPLCVFYADCVPILIADTKASVIAAVHSGWRGTVQRIAQKAIEKMCSEFGAMPENIRAAIGPSIGMCCFETGAEVAKHFDSDLCVKTQNDKYKVDLWEANRRILKGSGVKDKNIDVFGLCTICNCDMLYSYRSHGENTGRMGAFIALE